MLNWRYYRDPNLKYKVSIVVALLMAIIFIAYWISHINNTEIKGNTRFNKVRTTNNEYEQMKKVMDSFVSNNISKNVTNTPDVAVAPTIISDDTYTYINTDKDNVGAGISPNEKGKNASRLKLDYIIYFQDSLLGVYINELGVLRAIVVDKHSGNIRASYPNSAISIREDRGKIIALGNSENKYSRNLRKMVQSELNMIKVGVHTDKYFTDAGEKEFKYAMEQIKNSIYNNGYGLAIKFGKSNKNMVGKDRILICIYDIGVDKGNVDIMLKLNGDNKIFDIDIL